MVHLAPCGSKLIQFMVSMRFYGNKLIRSIQNIKRKQKTHLKLEKSIKHERLQNQ